MKVYQKMIALALSVIVICSFAGCGNKQEAKTEQPNTKAVSQEPEAAKSKTESSIVGTWVVEKNEIYDGPLKTMAEQVAETYYPVGAEYVFTEDGIFKSCAHEEFKTEYKILSDNQISCVTINNGETVIYDYELNGDTLILYSCYTDNVHTGYPSATYYKRK